MATMYAVPARYLPFLEAQIRDAVRSIKLDAELRDDEVLRARGCAAVPEQYIDHTAIGTRAVLVGLDRSTAATLHTAIAGPTVPTETPEPLDNADSDAVVSAGATL
jgi:hypothetical protein